MPRRQQKKHKCDEGPVFYGSARQSTQKGVSLKKRDHEACEGKGAIVGDP